MTRPTEPVPNEAQRAVTAVARARAHRRVAVGILSVNTILYAILILLIAFDKPRLALLLAPGLSLGIVLGSLVTVAAWLLTLIYVRWANVTDHAPGSD
jgi:uncharacterized membrane protein (DUF485 family)